MRFKKSILILSCVLAGGIFALLILFINLPGIVESQIQGRLPRFLGAGGVEFEIKKLGVANTLVSGIRITRGLSMDSVDIGYDIKRVSAIHLTRVNVSGLIVHADLDENNRIKIQGLEVPDTQKDQPGPQGNTFLSFLPERVVLKNAKLILHARDTDLLIPFDILATIHAKDGKIRAQALIYPFGDKMTIQATYDLDKGLEFLKADGHGVNLGHWAAFVSNQLGGMELKGVADFSMESSAPREKWALSVSGIRVSGPVEAAIDHWDTTLLIHPEKIGARGSLSVSLQRVPETVLEYDLTFRPGAGLKKEDLFDVSVKNSKTGPCQIVLPSTRAELKTPRINARFNGTLSNIKGEITLDVKEGRIQHPGTGLVFSDAVIRSDISCDFTGKGTPVSATFAMTAKKIVLQSDVADASFPVAGVSGNIRVKENKISSAGMRLTASQGKISASQFKIHASGIDLDIPIHYPGTGENSQGRYTIPAIVVDNQWTFSAHGTTLQTGLKTFQVTGAAGLETLPKLNAGFSARVGLEKGIDADVSFQTNPVQITTAHIKKMFSHPLGTTELDATVSAEGKAVYRQNLLNTALQVRINDGKIVLPDMNLTATGINTRVDLNDLVVLESVPGQVVTIDSIAANKIKINDARIRFSLEDAGTVLIENIRFKWCGGLVSSEAIRVPQKKEAYSLILYCDRLEMAQLLKQMGAFHAEGNGTLNGRIPVIYSDGNISFDNGFLFSTPGSSGKVVIENTQKLTAGIPMDSPQFAQLDLAREALKDFDYKWAKLLFNSFEDTLSVKMELDGSPSNILPFEYKKEIGSFVRVDASSPGSHFQGIKLDVNLNLPFNDVMKFGNKLKSILK